jgi:hypothetical protein
MNFHEFFGEPISIYTDADALEDGVLVDVSSLKIRFRDRVINRLTSNAWEAFKPFLVNPLEPESEEVDLNELKSILKTKLQYAYYKGDVWHLPPGLWLIENEVGGWTLMFPEDY